MKFDIPPQENSEQKPSPEKVEKSKKEAFNKMQSWLDQYDIGNFSSESLYANLKNQKFEVVEGGDTLVFDLNSFTESELAPLWLLLDSKLSQIKQNNLDLVQADSEEHRLLDSGDWEMGYDGKLNPHIQNPVLLGGVHGNEKTLPDELDRLLKYNEEIGQYKLDSTKGYVNHKVNTPALSMGVRSYSTAESRVSEDADMNRSEISDIETERIKEVTLAQIAGLEKPFVLDMHNDDKNEKPYAAFAVPVGFSPDQPINESLLFKIKLAKELGLKDFVMVDPEFAEGTMVGSAKQRNPNADGMIIEVPSNDRGHMSAKIALKYLSLSGAVNEGKPSVPLRLEHTLNDSFLDVSEDSEIEIAYYKVNKDVDENLHPKTQIPGREYMIRDGVPVEVQRLKIQNGSFVSNLEKSKQQETEEKIKNLKDEIGRM